MLSGQAPEKSGGIGRKTPTALGPLPARRAGVEAPTHRSNRAPSFTANRLTLQNGSRTPQVESRKKLFRATRCVRLPAHSRAHYTGAQQSSEAPPGFWRWPYTPKPILRKVVSVPGASGTGNVPDRESLPRTLPRG